MSEKTTPEPVVPSVDDPRHPRRRVLEQLQRMARAAALGGAALGLATTEAGCIVCDPLPPPMTCANMTHDQALARLGMTASWQPSDGGQQVVELTLTNHSGDSLSSQVTTSGAGLQGVTATGNALHVLLVPYGSEASVQVFFECDAGRTPIVVSLDLGSTDGGAAPIPVSLVSP